MIDILDFPDSNIVGFHLSDTLTEDDHETFTSHLRDQLKSHTTTRALFKIEDVDGWEPEDEWEEFALDIRHAQDLDKVAVIGDDPWEPLLEKIELLFPMSQLQTYEGADREEGLEWLRGEMNVPGIGPGSVPDPEAGAQDE